jgi:endonuclease-3
MPTAPLRPATGPARNATQAKPRPRPKPKRRRKPDPIKAWVRRLERTRPGLLPYVLDELSARYGHPVWESRWDPVSELVLTILTQNSADTNAERAYISLRAAYPAPGPDQVHRPGPGWGGVGLPNGPVPDWRRVEEAPPEELIEVIRVGGLPVGKAKGIQSALRFIRAARGNYALDFLADLPALEARAWLTQIPGIGKKTASILLLFGFQLPLMPVDRHVERVAMRVGLLARKATLDDAHEVFLAMLRPDQMYEAHVNLIRHGRLVCHAQRPEHERCPLRDRCRFVDPKAP